MNQFIYLVLITTFLLSISSCKTQQANSDTLKKVNSNLLLEKLENNQLQYEWFSTKASIKYSDSLNVQNFSSSIRMRKDSLIWLTVKKMGIEGGRALITPDSIRIINRLDKEYYPRDYGYLKRAYNLDIDFATLQELVVGNAIYPENDKAKSSTEDKYHLLTLQSKTQRNTFLLDPLSFLLQKMLFEELEQDTQVSMEFSDYNEVSGHQISMERKVLLASPETGKVRVDMAFSKVVINEAKGTPFVVNSRYKVIEP